MQEQTPGNRLGAETSPYLLQHKNNPVHWRPWGEEALAEARATGKPILISVGYSACHWCHVMAHESFEDEATAAVMNDLVVSVKVDREERPDVDAVYMEAVQAISGSGGWPMTVFLTPDGRPFFGGTYFPRAAFVDLVRRVAALWTSQRADLERQPYQVAEALRQGARFGREDKAGSGATFSPSLLQDGYRSLAAAFDPEWGGF